MTMNDEEKKELDKALNYFLDNDIISMEWDPILEEMAFYMTKEQEKAAEGGVVLPWQS
tara:strand:- start:162 stop:335 length:174 start_codon:yes stop_codon:yes gene_type:complete